MTVFNLKNTFAVIAITTVAGMSTASAGWSDWFGVDEGTKTKVQVISDVSKVTAEDVDISKTTAQVSTFWGGLKATGNGLWNLAKGYKTSYQNQAIMYYNGGRMAYGAANYAVGYIAGSEDYKAYGNKHMNQGSENFAATAKTVPGNIKDVVTSAVSTGTGAYEVIDSGSELYEKGLKVAGAVALVAACL